MLRVPDRLVSALRMSRHTVILTGAGVSAESGVPTFRDAHSGLWARYSPEELATPEAFRRDPGLVWRWYQWRREIIGKAQPNAAHMAIAGLERLMARVTLVTQNVDGLHQLAGSCDVLEFHGNIHRLRCSAEDRVVEVETTGTARPPPCPACGAPVRPDVVWFGEPIPHHVLFTAAAAASECDLFFSIGTSSIVYPAAGLADAAQAAGATLVEINPEQTPLSSAFDINLRGPAGVIMPRIVAQLA